MQPQRAHLRRLIGRFAGPVAASVMAVSVVQAQSGEWRTDFSKRSVPLVEIVSGGPSKDGIPAIDSPNFESVRQAGGWLKDPEPVVVVEAGGEARAYPIQVLIWHEIVNDRIGNRPVTVTFCPLCNTAIAFDGRVGDRVLTFGVSGRLRNSDMVMYDRQTESWWQQATGEGIVGELTGTRLTIISAPMVSWKTFRETWPEGKVLSRRTGHSRPYGQNPYASYDGPGGRPIPGFVSGKIDQSLPAMERVVAVTRGDSSLAIPFTNLAKDRVRHERLAGNPLVVFWAPGTSSALDAREIAQGRDVGATGVFVPQLDGRDLTFSAAGPGRFRDKETGSTWDILGRAVEGELAGQRLPAVPHGNHFWFAWSVFQPEGRLAR